MRIPSLDRVAFVISLVLISWGYGFATSARQWFPNDHLLEVMNTLREIRAVLAEDAHVATHPRVYERQGARAFDSTAVTAGLTLVPSVWPTFDWKPGLKLIDIRGRVIHQWEADPARIFPEEFGGPLRALSEFNQPHGAHLFPNGDVLVVFSRVGTARLDACGEVEWRVSAAHHHSVERASDGTFWLSASDSARKPDPFTGLGSDYHDKLVHLTDDGRKLGEIGVFEILRNNPQLLRRYFRFHHPDDAHLNDVEPLHPAMAEEYPMFEAGDLLLSFKHLNLVLVIDPSTLKVKWWAGRPFIQQHDPDFVGNGWIGVFDNNEDGTDRGRRFGGSRIVALQPHTDSSAVWFSSRGANPLYTSNRGNWEQLESGNYLITESNKGRVVEATPAGRIVWEWIQPPYSNDRVPRIYWSERYNISPRTASNWPCSPADSVTGNEQSA